MLGIRENRKIRQKYDAFAKNASIENADNKKEGAFMRHLLLLFEWLSVKSRDWCDRRYELTFLGHYDLKDEQPCKGPSPEQSRELREYA